MTDTPRNLPATYKAARQAMAALTSVDAVKEIRDKAIAMEVYAFQAKDPSLMEPAIATKKMAERRIGELMEEQRKAGLLAKPPTGKGFGRGNKERRGSKNPDLPTLEKQGVDKNLAKRARTAAAMSETKFEAEVSKTVKVAVAIVVNRAEGIKAAKQEKHQAARAKRADREMQVAGKIAALPAKAYGVIYADPEWKFETYSEDGKDGTSAENHYTTSSLEDIKARDVPSIAAPDCVLFLWATVPMLPQALEVMKAWGFEYKSHCIWKKDRGGTGFWFINWHELLLVGTRGKIPAPAQGDQWPSAIDAPRGKHSQKPEIFYELIEAYYPNISKIELNARKARKDWDNWGFEAPTDEAAA